MHYTKSLEIIIKSWLLILVALLMGGCHKEETIVKDYYEECKLIADIGTFELDPDSKKFLPYPENVSKIVFIDTLGKEFIGNVRFYDSNHSPTILLLEKPCPLDTSILIRYSYKPVYKRIRVELEELDIYISVGIHPVVSNESHEEIQIADVCSIFLGMLEFNLGANSYMSIVVNPRTDPSPYESYSEFLETHEIHGRNFHDVYVNHIDAVDDYEILYNSEFGIIGIRTNKNSMIDLVLDRIE